MKARYYIALGYALAYLTAIILSTLTAAHGHLIAHFKPHDTTTQHQHKLQQNQKHLAYVARYGKGKPQRAHAKALKWTRRELAQARRLLAIHWIPSVWYELAVCESGRRPPAWHIATGNGFYGGLQFSSSTWLQAGGGRYAPYAHLALPWQQVAIARSWLAETSWSQWPACSAKLGLR